MSKIMHTPEYVRFPDGAKPLYRLGESAELTDYENIYKLSYRDMYRGILKDNECELYGSLFGFTIVPYSILYEPAVYIPKPNHRVYVNDILFFRVKDHKTAAGIIRSINRRKKQGRDLYRKVARLTYIDADNKILSYESPVVVAQEEVKGLMPTEEMYEKLKRSRIGKFLTYEPISKAS